MGIKDILIGNLTDLAEIKGSLQNSGVYAIFLSIHLPIIFYLTKSENKIYKIGAIFLLLITIAVIYCTHSRSAYMVVIAFTVLIFSFHLKQLYNKSVYNAFILLSTCLALCVAFFMLSIKQGSTLGRILIWKISFTQFLENFFWGIGYGEFYRYYPVWQIEYFQNVAASKNEILNADESFVAYSELLQFLVETGIFGFIFFLFFAMWTLKCLLDAKCEFTKYIIMILFLILISSSFSYSLHVNAVVFLFIFCLAVISNNQSKHNVPTKCIVSQKISFVFALILIISLISSLSTLKYVVQWEKIRNDIVSSNVDLEKYFSNIYPALKQNGKFLLDNSQAIYKVDQAKAILLVEEAVKEFPSVATYSFASHLYEINAEYGKAISMLKSLVGLQPYKFATREKLVKMYLQDRDTTNALLEIKTILSMPVKIKSSEVNTVKNRALILKRNLLREK